MFEDPAVRAGRQRGGSSSAHAAQCTSIENLFMLNRDIPHMLMHECGYEQEVICRRCGNPMVYNKRLGLYCPKCGHETTLLCPGCGKKW
jgi:hypothetical protein